jgi:glutamate-1-semialdehyde aminotransferase/spore coat polysaccharide biosynthesis protein SpsF (cytidylyltransferase family)
MKKITAIIQARMSSTRLPQKILLKVLKKTLLEYTVERANQAKRIKEVIVATTTNPADQPVVNLMKKLGIKFYRGSENNVLDRYYQTAKKFKIQHIARLTSDCPIIDPQVIDQIAKKYFDSQADYCSNTLKETFPDGQDVEIFSFKALSQAWKNAKLSSEKEHVTPYLKKHPKKFKLVNLKHSHNLNNKRWTVDESADFKFIKIVIQNLYPQNPNFSMTDILKFLQKNPRIEKINQSIIRNEGYLKSLMAEKIKKGKSQRLYQQAKKIIPGGTQLLSKRPEMYLPDFWPAYYQKAKGCEVWDLDNKKYIDMSYMAVGPCLLGYANNIVNQAVKKAIDKGSITTLNCPEEIELAEILCQIHPWAKKVRYARTGGESMTMAIRIARAKTKKDKILFCGYHGWHDWYLSANLSDDSSLDGHLLPGLTPSGVPRGLKNTAFPFEYNNLKKFQQLIRKHRHQIAAVVMEPIRNFYPKKNFLEAIRKITLQERIILIFDEVSSGFRLNIGGAHLKLGVNPDIAVFAKAISNGHPMGAIIGKAGVMNAIQTAFISSTYCTEKVGPVAALATIKELKAKKVPQYLDKIGRQIQLGWQKSAQKNGLDITVSGIPALGHFTFNYEKPLVLKTLFTQEMLKKGFLATNAFYASYAHKSNHIKEYLQTVDHTFKFIVAAINSGNPQKYLQGPVCHGGFKRLT